MADGSWDNGGYGVPTKVGMPTWVKVVLGCGVAAVLAMATCVGGGVYLAHRLKQDPGLKAKMMGFAVDRFRPDWEDFRQVVEQLRTQEGCRALYTANPDLATRWPKEAEFLAAAKAWQPALASAPELTSDLIQQHGTIQISRELGGKVRISWRPKEGPGVSVTFDRPRKPGDASTRRVLEVQVR